MFAVSMNACAAAMKTSEPPHTTSYHYIDVNLDMTVLLFTAILAFVMGNFLMYGIKTASWTAWRPSQDVSAEEETLEEVSSPAERSVGVETELHMCNVMDLADHIREVTRMDDGFVERHTHEMEMERLRMEIIRIQSSTMSETAHAEELQRREEIWVAERAEILRNHQQELREITQNPIYFTRSGRVWHADARCPRRFTDQGIFIRGYCTLCAHFLGREAPPGEFGDGEPEPL